MCADYDEKEKRKLFLSWLTSYFFSSGGKRLLFRQANTFSFFFLFSTSLETGEIKNYGLCCCCCCNEGTNYDVGRNLLILGRGLAMRTNSSWSINDKSHKQSSINISHQIRINELKSINECPPRCKADEAITNGKNNWMCASEFKLTSEWRDCKSIYRYDEMKCRTGIFSRSTFIHSHINIYMRFIIHIRCINKTLCNRIIRNRKYICIWVDA